MCLSRSKALFPVYAFHILAAFSLPAENMKSSDLLVQFTLMMFYRFVEISRVHLTSKEDVKARFQTHMVPSLQRLASLVPVGENFTIQT